MEKGKKYAAIHYAKYLELEKILECQVPRSTEFGEEAHDELLFIITHQAYELWFKQILHELEGVVGIMNDLPVSEKKLAHAVHYLDRTIKIMHLLIQQLEVLETMTPMDFLEFRNYLFPASGFQSFQFRKAEVMLGLKNKHRITYGGHHYAAFFEEKQKEELEKLENNPSMLELLEKWLERTPFIDHKDFNFLENYKKALENLFEVEQNEIRETEYLSEQQKAMRLKMLGDSDTFFKLVFDQASYNKEYEAGNVRISYKAMLAMLFISLYRDEPILQLPYLMIQKLSEIDEFLTLWRFRHGQMVRRIIGSKIGTGGSVGVDYLMETASKHTIFKDIHYVSTLMIPKKDLPLLPDTLVDELNYHYRSK
jgi:tryptophan 2,3-dioxygenase